MQKPENRGSFKVAVCFSGQARYWKECVDNIRKFFEYDFQHFFTKSPIETDYFIHTWDTNTWRYPKEEHSKFYEEKINNIEEIALEYKAKKYIQEKFDQKRFSRAWDPMFYSFSRSLFLKREYEIEKNFEYDVVIKARLDVIYNPEQKINLSGISVGVNGLIPGVCYTIRNINKFSYEFNYNSFDDVLFYGDSRTMDLVGDLYFNYKIIHNIDELIELRKGINILPSTFYGPGTLLYEHMVSMGIHPECKENIEYCVMRSTAVADNLDSIKDYEEIKKRWIDWYI